jgi:tripartite-type tricarboxylate transporter receptor subunit TctC
VLEFHFNQKLLGRPLAAPPGIPVPRLMALRKAFHDTMRDPEFRTDAQKSNLDIDPATAEQVQELLAQFADYPQAVIDRAMAAAGR